MGFDHMALVRQNTPYITREGRGAFGRLDLEFLLMIAEPIPASRETPEWFMPMSEIKHRLRMKPETRDADVIRIYKHVVKLGYLKVHNGTGRKANTYILTDTIMKGAAPPPERKAKAVDPEHVCDCEGKDHTNDAACRQYRSYQKKKGKGGNANRVAKPTRVGKPAAPVKATHYCRHINIPQNGKLVDHPHTNDKAACDEYKRLHPPGSPGMIR